MSSERGTPEAVAFSVGYRVALHLVEGANRVYSVGPVLPMLQEWEDTAVLVGINVFRYGMSMVDAVEAAEKEMS